MRLIDADALIAEYDRVHVGPPGGARKLMIEAPTIEAEPVKHGRWIEITEFLMDVEYKCSCCNEMFCTIDGTPFDNLYNYCPNCGAKMTGDAE